MGIFGWLFFNDEDNVIIDELMKLHKIDKSKRDLVKVHYEKMLKDISEDDEIKNKD